MIEIPKESKKKEGDGDLLKLKSIEILMLAKPFMSLLRFLWLNTIQFEVLVYFRCTRFWGFGLAWLFYSSFLEAGASAVS